MPSLTVSEFDYFSDFEVLHDRSRYAVRCTIQYRCGEDVLLKPPLGGEEFYVIDGGGGPTHEQRTAGGHNVDLVKISKGKLCVCV